LRRGGDAEQPISHLPTIQDVPRPGHSATWRESAIPTPSQPATRAHISADEEMTQVYPLDSTQGGGGRLSSGSGLDASLATTGRKSDRMRPVSETPTQIGDYRILRELGRGGMGVVYEAMSETLGRKVALKVLLSGTGATEHDRARFLVEAKAASKLRHPNVVRVLEYRQEGTETFLAMDMIDGTSLQKQVEDDGHFDDRKSAEICLKMAEAIAHAHEQGILHRDIKPHNVLLDATQGGEPMITDFGLAKLLEDQGVSLTADGPVMMGTPGYMPPEQAGAGYEIDRRADVYSLGATLYYMLTGRPPFQGKSMPQVLMAVVRKRPVPPSKRREGVAAALETICLKCLEKDPQDRYPSAQALVEDLQRFLNDLRIQARRVGPVVRAQRWATRNPVAAAAAAAGVTATLAVVGWGAAQVIEARRAIAAANASPSPVATTSPRTSPTTPSSPPASIGPVASPTATASPTPVAVLPPPDTQAPRLEVISPQPGWVTASDTVSVLAVAVDESELDLVELDGEAFQPQAERDRYELLWELDEDGEHEAVIVARDLAGNVTSQTITVVRDTTPPRVEEVRWEPPGASVEVESVQVTVVLSEPAEGAIGDVPAEASRDAEGRGLLTATLSLELGRNAFEVTCEDRVANASRHAFEIERALHHRLRGAWWEPPLNGPQARWAVENDLPIVIEEEGFTFVLIAPGTFRMGSPKSERELEGEDEAPHQVELTQAYYLSATEVTNAQLRRFFPDHDSRDSSKIRGASKDRVLTLNDPEQPAVGVSWQVADSFCERLSEAVQHPGRYRLPTEAEWEYACRGGAATRWYWGEDPDQAPRYANLADRNANRLFRWGREVDAGKLYFELDDPHEVTAPVGSYAPNAWGLYDMTGNASEWVFDVYRRTYDVDPSGPRVDPKVTHPSEAEGALNRVYRGGSFLSRPSLSRSADRKAAGPTKRPIATGFRLWRVAERPR
jgi:serine/threonine protein kinase/formylglycine-generating enzyme required for sulfatase activity